LLNRIAKREAAIVSPFAGTTRDVIEVHLDLDGYPVTLLDTAGVRETDDPVEQEGVRRARDRAAAADLVLWITEAGGLVADFPRFGGMSVQKKVPALPLADQSAASPGTAGLKATAELVADKASSCSRQTSSSGPVSGPMAENPPVWLIQNKIDLLLPGSAPARSEPHNLNELEFVSISATGGAGIEELLRRLEDYATNFFGEESGLITRERHRSDLTLARAALARSTAEGAGREEIVAEELRLAARALGRLTGKVDVEDVLDVIFRDFCIGK
jgi:tRNA modification GTPase